MSFTNDCFINNNVNLFKKLYVKHKIADPTTYLYNAIKCDCDEIFGFLLKEVLITCNENDINDILSSSLDQAITNKNMEIIKMLIPKINLKTFKINMNPQEFDDNIHILELLFKNGLGASNITFSVTRMIPCAMIDWPNNPFYVLRARAFYQYNIFMFALHFEQIKTVELIVTKYRHLIPDLNVVSIEKAVLLAPNNITKNRPLFSIKKKDAIDVKEKIILLLAVNNLLNYIEIDDKIHTELTKRIARMSSNKFLDFAINNLRLLELRYGYDYVKKIINSNNVFNDNDITATLDIIFNNNLTTNAQKNKSYCDILFL